MYDVIVIGAGLHALTFLCALLEDHPMADHLVDASKGIVRSKLNERAMRAALQPRPKSSLNLAVVDPHGRWLQNWKSQFQTLNIHFLRSNAGLHPDPVDPEMLFEFARAKGYPFDQAFVELNDIPRGKSFTGPFQLPTTRVFNDFCESLIDRYGLRDIVIKDRVHSIDPERNEKFHVSVKLGGSRRLLSRRVVVAIGHTGLPRVPDWVDLGSFPSTALMHAWDLVHRPPTDRELMGQSIAVVGGGLTAVQLVQLAIYRGSSEVVLLSRRPLDVRPFDSDLSWSGRQRYLKLQTFWKEQDFEKRAKFIKAARKGGTVTASAQTVLQEMVDEGTCKLLEGIEIWDAEWTGYRFRLELSDDNVLDVDRIWLATGSAMDVHREPVFSSLMNSHPVGVVGGYPVLTEDLKWHPDVEVYVVGGYASLLLGPDGVNLAGARRAAFKLRSVFQSLTSEIKN